MKKTYLNSFCARFLTLLVLALMSTNLAWGDSYTITFANNVSSATALSNTTKSSTVIAEGGRSYVKEQPFNVKSGKCYYGDTKNVFVWVNQEKVLVYQLRLAKLDK